MYEGKYRYASGISRSSGEDVGDIIKLYARADGVVKRGTIEFGFIFAVIIGIVFVALVKMWKENQGYTPIPSHPRGIMVDDYDDLNDSSYNNSSNYSMNNSYNNLNNNFSAGAEESEQRTQSQQTEEIPQGMRVIEIPEKYL